MQENFLLLNSIKQNFIFSWSALNTAAKNDDDFITCVKQYSKAGKCVTCLGKERISSDVRMPIPDDETRLTKLIDSNFIVSRGSDTMVATCRSTSFFPFSFSCSARIEQLIENTSFSLQIARMNLVEKGLMCCACRMNWSKFWNYFCGWSTSRNPTATTSRKIEVFYCSNTRRSGKSMAEWPMSVYELLAFRWLKM